MRLCLESILHDYLHQTLLNYTVYVFGMRLRRLKAHVQICQAQTRRVQVVVTANTWHSLGVSPSEGSVASGIDAFTFKLLLGSHTSEVDSRAYTDSPPSETGGVVGDGVAGNGVVGD